MRQRRGVRLHRFVPSGLEQASINARNASPDQMNVLDQYSALDHRLESKLVDKHRHSRRACEFPYFIGCPPPSRIENRGSSERTGRTGQRGQLVGEQVLNSGHVSVAGCSSRLFSPACLLSFLLSFCLWTSRSHLSRASLRQVPCNCHDSATQHMEHTTSQPGTYPHPVQPSQSGL